MSLLRTQDGKLYRSADMKLVAGTCTSVYCPRACCFGSTCVDGVCPDVCTGLGGTSLSLGTTCASNPCEPPPGDGACCVWNPGLGIYTCSSVTAAECATLGGIFIGEGVACGDINCNDETEPACCDGKPPGTCYTLNTGAQVVVAAEVTVTMKAHFCCNVSPARAENIEGQVSHSTSASFTPPAGNCDAPYNALGPQSCSAWSTIGTLNRPLADCFYSPLNCSASSYTIEGRLCLTPRIAAGVPVVDVVPQFRVSGNCINAGNPFSAILAGRVYDTNCVSQTLQSSTPCPTNTTCFGTQQCGDDFTSQITASVATASNRDECGVVPFRMAPTVKLLASSGSGCLAGCGGGFGGGFAL